MPRINLWASPRNVSTALMYSFAQRKDTAVVDEPLYAHFLNQSGVIHPGQAEILASQENDGEKVIQDLLMATPIKEVVFFKQMTHHLINISTDFLSQCKNILLIREPAAFISSYIKVLPDPKMEDIGLKQQWELCEQLKANDSLTAIIDAKQLLLDPRGVLTKLCLALGIAFDENMLHWQAGPIPEDGIWAPYWYHNVHASTGFQVYKEKVIQIPERLNNLLEEAQFYYQKLLPLAINAEISPS